jgi:endonuclease/exonuclease/phosphatase (EEP) superfamily protein YafD
MTKQDLQKELLEKVKPGTKPSHLKKLKRSKSADDIPASPPQEKQITNLQEQVKFHSQTAANYLKSLQTSQAKVIELEERLKSSPTNSEELDNSLIARHQNLKD